MRLVVLAALLIVGTPASAAPAMSVDTFLTRAQALKKKGALAIFSGDLKVLTNQVKADSASLRAENRSLSAAGKPRAYCAPEKFGMDDDEIMAAMQAVPADRRAGTSTKSALRDYLARRFPCRS